jgi:hypothetical protein
MIWCEQHTVIALRQLCRSMQRAEHLNVEPIHAFSWLPSRWPEALASLHCCAFRTPQQARARFHLQAMVLSACKWPQLTLGELLAALYQETHFDSERARQDSGMCACRRCMKQALPPSRRHHRWRSSVVGHCESTATFRLEQGRRVSCWPLGTCSPWPRMGR